MFHSDLLERKNPPFVRIWPGFHIVFCAFIVVRAPVQFFTVFASAAGTPFPMISLFAFNQHCEPTTPTTAAPSVAPPHPLSLPFEANFVWFRFGMLFVVELRRFLRFLKFMKWIFLKLFLIKFSRTSFYVLCVYCMLSSFIVCCLLLDWSLFLGENTMQLIIM